MKKEPKMRYGIAITKPFSSEMYDHNDKVAEIMKTNITKALNNRRHTVQDLDKMATHITGYRFGVGMSRDAIREDLLNAVSSLANWWLAQEYDYLVTDGYCKPVEFNMIGFDKDSDL